MVLILTTLQVSVLIANATVPSKPSMIDSIEQLASREDYKVLVYKGSSSQETIKVWEYSKTYATLVSVLFQNFSETITPIDKMYVLLLND